MTSAYEDISASEDEYVNKDFNDDDDNDDDDKARDDMEQAEARKLMEGKISERQSFHLRFSVCFHCV
jgi:hypothetical protein